jgi:hypothetical protein
MANWLSRFFGGGDDDPDSPIEPTGTDHDYRPHACDRAHDWAVLSDGDGDSVGVGDGVDTMRIEAWGGQFRRGDQITIGSPATSWWIVGVTAEGNTWFPDRAVLDLAISLDQGRTTGAA